MSGTNNNLVAERTSFVGRRRELDELLERIEAGTRLLTIMGAPGTGKTRLARRLGTAILERRPPDGGVWFCDLTECACLADVLAVLAAELRVPLTESDASASCGLLGRVLAGRGHIVVILDNCEQIVGPVAAAVGVWLDCAPDAQLLATSRERLAIAGEVCFDLEPLLEPHAVQLFVERAAAARAGFALSAADRSVAIDLVHQLDRIPLAIELAASRVNVLPLQAIRERLATRFQLLSSPHRDVRGRQTTLRHAIDWSWDLLEPWHREAFAQCAVFRGGFSVDAAEAVLVVDAVGAPALVLDVLQALRDKSLIRSYTPASALGEIRFGMLESLREYAAQRLDESGQRSTVESRHAAFYVCAAESWSREISCPQEATALAHMVLELDNLLAVCRRCLAADPTVAVRAALSVDALLALRGPFDLHADVLDGAVEAARRTESIDLQVDSLIARARAQRVRNRLDAAAADLAQALALAHGAGLHDRESEVLRARGLIYAQQGEREAAADHLDRALALVQSARDRAGEGRVLRSQGNIFLEAGNLERARARYVEALAIHCDLGDRRAEAIALGNLGLVEMDLCQHDSALAHLEGALEIHRELGDRRFEAVFAGNLATLQLDRGKLGEAKRLFERALSLHRAIGSRRFEAMVMFNLAVLKLIDGRLDDAGQLLEPALTMTGHDPRVEGTLHGFRGVLEATRDRLRPSEAAYEVARARLGALGDARLIAMLEVLEAALDLAHARAAMGDGDRESAEGHAERAHVRVRAARAPRPGGGRDGHGSSPAERSHDVRLALRIVESLFARDGRGGVDEPALVIAGDGRWFRRAGGGRVAIARRRVLRRILLCLARKRVAHPGRGLSVEALIAAGWPGETLMAESGSSRVYMSIRELRRLGLDDVLITRDDGYLLREDVAVVVEESTSAAGHSPHDRGG